VDDDAPEHMGPDGSDGLDPFTAACVRPTGPATNNCSLSLSLSLSLSFDDSKVLTICLFWFGSAFILGPI